MTLLKKEMTVIHLLTFYNAMEEIGRNAQIHSLPKIGLETSIEHGDPQCENKPRPKLTNMISGNRSLLPCVRPRVLRLVASCHQNDQGRVPRGGIPGLGDNLHRDRTHRASEGEKH